MKHIIFAVAALLLLAAPLCFAQDPMPVLTSAWRYTTEKAPKVETPRSGPAKEITNDDKPMVRNLRQIQVDNSQDPTETTPDGRRAAIDKIESEARAPQPDDIRGFSYTARVKNLADKTAKVVYWEYVFAEIARPANVVRRQFLCAVNLKKDDEIELSAFSAKGPADVIDAVTLAKSQEKRFNETVRVNRIEYSDGGILQRGDWKLADVKADVARVTSTPWGKEMCRAL
jgi:hypothetical protein